VNKALLFKSIITAVCIVAVVPAVIYGMLWLAITMPYLFCLIGAIIFIAWIANSLYISGKK
jgi:hypothetical protein